MTNRTARPSPYSLFRSRSWGLGSFYCSRSSSRDRTPVFGTQSWSGSFSSPLFYSNRVWTYYSARPLKYLHRRSEVYIRTPLPPSRTMAGQRTCKGNVGSHREVGRHYLIVPSPKGGLLYKDYKTLSNVRRPPHPPPRGPRTQTNNTGQRGVRGPDNGRPRPVCTRGGGPSGTISTWRSTSAGGVSRSPSPTDRRRTGRGRAYWWTPVSG